MTESEIMLGAVPSNGKNGKEKKEVTSQQQMELALRQTDGFLGQEKIPVDGMRGRVVEVEGMIREGDFIGATKLVLEAQKQMEAMKKLYLTGENGSLRPIDGRFRALVCGTACSGLLAKALRVMSIK